MSDYFTVFVSPHVSSLSHSLTLFAVNVILKERKSKDSITLAWQGPDRPNGVILEYEVIYYEKVHLISSPLRFPPGLLEQVLIHRLHTCLFDLH